MDAETYIAESVVPSSLRVLDPMSTRLSTKDPEADMFGVTPDHVYAYRLLDAASDVYARWFIVMKAAVSRERVRQRLYCEEAGISVNTRLPYERPLLTAAEQSTVELCRSVIGRLFDTKVSEYAMLKFRKAVDTGDMRSFKIRLLVLKSRDSLKGSRLYNGFSEGAEECITKAERLAGCVPDPSPRRLSRAEKARVSARRQMETQPTLFDAYGGMPCQPDRHIPQEKECRVGSAADKPTPSAPMPTAPAGSVDNLLITPLSAGESAGPAGDGNTSRKPSSEAVQYIEKGPISDYQHNSDGIAKPLDKTGEAVDKIKRSDVTVTTTPVTKCVTVTDEKRVSATVRKTKVYSSVSEISSDISSGLIVPYKTNEEVVQDIRSGVITPAEAVLFLSELIKRKRSESAHAMDDAVARDLDRKAAGSMESRSLYRGAVSDMEMGDEDIEDEDEPDDESDEVDDDTRAEDGFGGADGGYKLADSGGYNLSDSEWCPDDDW